MSVQSCSRFLCESLFHPGQVGAIGPSSHSLALRMVRWINWERVGSVAEYGPGTGVVTEQILRSKQQDTRFFAVELNPNFVAALTHRFPGLPVWQDSVANIEAICRQQDVPALDVVISGLPWAAFSDRQQNEYLDAMLKVLNPGGYFATFAYLPGMALPSARRFRRKLRDYFNEVRIDRTVWVNVPPAFVYQCRL